MVRGHAKSKSTIRCWACGAVYPVPGLRPYYEGRWPQYLRPELRDWLGVWLNPYYESRCQECTTPFVYASDEIAEIPDGITADELVRRFGKPSSKATGGDAMVIKTGYVHESAYFDKWTEEEAGIEYWSWGRPEAHYRVCLNRRTWKGFDVRIQIKTARRPSLLSRLPLSRWLRSVVPQPRGAGLFKVCPRCGKILGLQRNKKSARGWYRCIRCKETFDFRSSPR